MSADYERLLVALSGYTDEQLQAALVALCRPRASRNESRCLIEREHAPVTRHATITSAVEWL